MNRNYPILRVLLLGVIPSLICFAYLIYGCRSLIHSTTSAGYSDPHTEYHAVILPAIKDIVLFIIALSFVNYAFQKHKEYLHPRRDEAADEKAGREFRDRLANEEARKRKEATDQFKSKAEQHNRAITDERERRSDQIASLEKELKHYREIPSLDSDDSEDSDGQD